MTAHAALSLPPALQVQRILFATDFSEGSQRALPIAAAIARQFKADLLLAYVWDDVTYAIAEAGFVCTPNVDECFQRDLKHPTESVDLEGIPTKTVIAHGDPANSLARLAEAHDVQLTVVGTHGRTGMKHALLGSVAEALLRTLSCGVLTIGPNAGLRNNQSSAIHRILFPTDLSPSSNSVLPIVAGLSQAFDAEVAVLHVFSGPVEEERRPKLAELCCYSLERRFGPLLPARPAPRYAVEFGDPAKEILRFAERMQADLISIGVHKASQLAAQLRTTTTYRLVLGARCPVLVSSTR
jgi:nucleotide-binding universal stress UspA family protein